MGEGTFGHITGILGAAGVGRGRGVGVRSGTAIRLKQQTRRLEPAVQQRRQPEGKQQERGNAADRTHGRE